MPKFKNSNVSFEVIFKHGLLQENTKPIVRKRQKGDMKVMTVMRRKTNKRKKPFFK